ncbi:MAG TPA: MarR family transcriptional regulator [Solirubrobacterales bacterium]|nr:MarR family transcriptional regulator [Solirubrobacterales bacterium]
MRFAAVLFSTTVRNGSLLEAIEESGLTMTQIKVLAALGRGEDDGPRPGSELAAEIGASMPTASRAIEALVKKRLVTRAEDAKDRRVRRIAITRKGARLVHELVARRTAALEDFVNALDEDQRRKLDGALEALLGLPEVDAAYRQLGGAR